MRYKHSAIGPWMRHPKDGGIHTQQSGRLPGPKPWVRRPQEGAHHRQPPRLEDLEAAAVSQSPPNDQATGAKGDGEENARESQHMTR